MAEFRYTYYDNRGLPAYTVPATNFSSIYNGPASSYSITINQRLELLFGNETSSERLYELDNLRIYFTIERGAIVADFSDNLARVDLSGTTRGDILRGGSANDTLNGLDGDDVLEGNAGGDQLYGGGGDDVLEGGAGDDLIDGGNGSDTASYEHAVSGLYAFLALPFLNGSIISVSDSVGDSYSSIENLRGSAFADFLFGDTGNNIIEGGGGGDRIEGSGGTDTASYAHSTSGVKVDLATGSSTGGDAQGDTLVGIRNLIGSAQADRLTGDGSGNALDGGAGNDALVGGAGADTLDGGAGTSDTAVYTGSGAGVSVDLTLATAQSGGEAAGDILSGIENIQGSGQDDTLTGNGNANLLLGYAGNDTIDGGGGNDRIDGGTDADAMAGGAGNDTFFVDDAGDSVSDASGSDTVFVTADWTLDAGEAIEFLRANVGTGVAITGNALENTIYGSAGNDTVSGGAGRDQLFGGAGRDTFAFEALSDSNAAGRDTIRDFVSGTDTIDLSRIGTQAGDGHFHLDLAAAGFTRTAGQLIVTHNTGSTQVQGDANGDGRGDLLIVLGGTIALTANDFDLS